MFDDNGMKRDGLAALEELRRDDTWASIVADFTNGVPTESARLQRSSALLSVATDDSRDAAALMQATLQILARRYGSISRT